MRENATLERTFGFASEVHYDMHYDLPGTLYKDLANLYPNTCASTQKNYIQHLIFDGKSFPHVRYFADISG